MSSFEPLFGRSATAFRTPQFASVVTSDALWIPKQVDEAFERIVDHPFGSFTDEDESEKVRQRAEARLREQQHQAEVDASYQRGLAEGRDAGERAERMRLRGAVAAAEAALDVLREGEARWLVHLEENIAAIATAVAQQIIAREVSLSTDIVRAMITRGVQEFALDQSLTIRINPNDLEALESAERIDATTITPVTAEREVRWVADPRLECGGCVIEGRERIVDGRVDTALERLYRRLSHTNA